MLERERKGEREKERKKEKEIDRLVLRKTMLKYSGLILSGRRDHPIDVWDIIYGYHSDAILRSLILRTV